MLSSDSFAALNGKVVVITGGSGGIGKAVAEAATSYGASVVIGDILEKQGQTVVEEFNTKAGKKVAAFIRTDVTKYADNQNLFKLAESEFGGVDYTLLNAGTGDLANSMFTPMDDEVEERIMQINATGVIKGTKVALLHMAKRGGGSIVHLASAAGFFSGANLASYNASKHAVIGYTRSFALMPQICNVRANAVCPYWVDTDIIKYKPGYNEKSFTDYAEKCPRTQMSTVVEAVLQYFVDESKNTETVLALPDGLQVVPGVEAPASFFKEGTLEAAMELAGRVIADGKADLVKAREAYGI